MCIVHIAVADGHKMLMNPWQANKMRPFLRFSFNGGIVRASADIINNV